MLKAQILKISIFVTIFVCLTSCESSRVNPIETSIFNNTPIYSSTIPPTNSSPVISTPNTITPSETPDDMHGPRIMCEIELDPALTRNQNSQSDGESYILYRKSDTEGDTYWLIEPKTGYKQQISIGYIPIGWSPSKDILLLYKDQALFSSEADSSNPSLIWSFPEGTDIFSAWWLSDNCLIIDIQTVPDASGPFGEPRPHVLDLSTGMITGYGPDDFRITQAISLSDHMWIQGDSTKYELVDLYGSTAQIPNNIGIVLNTQPKADPWMAFLPSGGQLISFGADTVPINGKYIPHIFQASLLDGKISSPRPIYDLNGFHSSLRVSPNSKTVAFIEEGDRNLVVTLLDLHTLTATSYTPWDNLTSTLEFVWSPDSQLIAFSYHDAGVHKLVVFYLASEQLIILEEINGWLSVLEWEHIDFGR